MAEDISILKDALKGLHTARIPEAQDPDDSDCPFQEIDIDLFEDSVFLTQEDSDGEHCLSMSLDQARQLHQVLTEYLGKAGK